MAGRLGTAALAAHQVVGQLWLLTSYAVDGFAVAGTVLGSRLAEHLDSFEGHRWVSLLLLCPLLFFCLRLGVWVGPLDNLWARILLCIIGESYIF